MKRTVAFFTIAVVLLVFSVSGCHKDLFPSSHLSGTPPQELIEIMSIVGPLQPINPGGPVVEVTLKNAATVPVISLTASLSIDRAGPPNLPPFTFNFRVTSDSPLLPGNSTSTRQTLIGGGFSDNVSYPVMINGTLQNGTGVVYTKQVQIVPYAK